MKTKWNFALVILLMIGLIDHIGLGLVYPIFTSLLFDPNTTLVSESCSVGTRGLLLGLLIGVTPLTQFFSSPILGTLSDAKGRKKILIIGVFLGFIGYLCAIIGIWINSLFLLFFCRLLVGISDGTVAVAQAALADIATEETKVRYFSLFNMALGVGFTMGPFLGGRLADPSLGSWCSYMTPFWVAAAVVLINFILIIFKLPESKPHSIEPSKGVLNGLYNLKDAFYWKELRFFFLGSFAFTFGWTFFVEFVPLFLKNQFAFTTSEIGNFFAYMGLWYALSTGFLTLPLLKRLTPQQIVPISLLALGVYLPTFLLIEDTVHIWVYLPFIFFLLALIYPSAAALVSNQAGEHVQGKVLGVYHSVNAFATGISPLCAGSFVALHPSLTVWVGASMMILASVAFRFGVYIEKKQTLAF
jgi:DHA1 family tetracycline resistance protein-like MFS transporter